MRHSLKVGIAIGRDVFAASWATSHWETSLTDGPTADAIRGAISELKARTGVKQRVSVSVAILPPLARIRRIDLPRMSPEDRRLAVTTNARQFFIGCGETPVCAAIAIKDGPRSGAPLLAAAAASELIDEIMSSLSRVSWTIVRIVPAQAVWAKAIVARHPLFRRGRARIGVCVGGERNVLELASGSLVRVRRLRASEPLSSSDPGERWHFIGSDRGQPSVAVLAAAAARMSSQLEIVPETMRRRRLARDRRVSGMLTAFACACALGTAVTHRWALDRELSSVTARRAALRSRAERAMAAREATQRISDDVRAFAGLERSAPRWSAALSRIGLSLPEEAELTWLHADADSLVLEGQAKEASRVVSTLRRTPGLTGTKLIAPVTHERSPDQAPTERWRLALRVDHSAVVGSR